MPHRKPFLYSLVSVFGLLLLMGAPTTSTALNTADTIKQKSGSDILLQSYETYAKLNSFTCRIESLVETYQSVKTSDPQKQLFQTVCRVEKPSRVSLIRTNPEKTTDQVIADEKFYYVSTTDPNRLRGSYLKVPISLRPQHESMLLTPSFAGLRPELPSSLLVPQVLWGVHYLSATGWSWKFVNTSVVQGEPVDCITYRSSDRPARVEWTLFISKKDSLLRKSIKRETDQKGTVVVVTEQYQDIQVNPSIPNTEFTFTPPPNKEPQTVFPTWPNTAVGKELPPFPDPFPVIALDGERFSLADYRGKVVLVDFWGSWCAPCLAGMPEMVSRYERHQKKGLEIVGVAIDTNADGVFKLMQKYGMRWRQILDADGKLANNGYVPDGVGVPYTILIGRDGRVRSLNLHGEALESAIKEALEESTPIASP